MSPRAILASLVVAGAASACDEHADFNLRLRATAPASLEATAEAPALVARGPVARAAEVRGANQTLCACSCLPASGRALVTTRVD
jgi:hypothetical protein